MGSYAVILLNMIWHTHSYCDHAACKCCPTDCKPTSFILFCSSCAFQIPYHRWTFSFYNDYRLERESCSKIEAGGSWNPEYCTESLPFLCEKPPRKMLIFSSWIRNCLIFLVSSEKLSNIFAVTSGYTSQYWKGGGKGSWCWRLSNWEFRMVVLNIL